MASVPHSIVNGFKNLLAVAAATDVEFKEAMTVKEFLKVLITIFLFPRFVLVVSGSQI